jgi:hypothetical protein
LRTRLSHSSGCRLVGGGPLLTMRPGSLYVVAVLELASGS